MDSLLAETTERQAERSTPERALGYLRGDPHRKPEQPVTPTPGRWKVEQQGSIAPHVLVVHSYADDGTYRGQIAYCQPAEHINGITREEVAANARLIGAAPELLAALCALADRFEAWDRSDLGEGDTIPSALRGTTRDDVRSALLEARAALALAHGEEVRRG